MYKDIYNWAERELYLESSKILMIKKYAYQNACTDIKAVMDNNICTRDQMVKAIKDIYQMETYEGNITGIKPIREMGIADMVTDGFVVTRNPENAMQVLILLTKPQSKLVIIGKVKESRAAGEIVVKFIFDDDFETWKNSNKKDINENKLNAVASSLGNTRSVFDEKYDADEEELSLDSIVGIVNNVILEAVNENASDIHIEPYEEEIKIRFRVDGILKVHSIIANKAIHPQIVTRIKVLAKMDTNNFKTPQSGKINMIILDKEVDMRISTLPSIYGEKVTIRILVSQNVKIRTLEELGIRNVLAEKLRYLAARPHGIILISGPTGSGKSSTLASVLTEINKSDSCLVTIEDPVEYKIKDATQVNVSEVTGLTFASVLREVLRQDPDIIMVGEIRDTETAKTAMTASSTGHLVFSTLHTNGAASAIARLSDMGVDHYMIADSLIGVLSQRLVKVLCPHCKKPHVVNQEDVSKYRLPKYMLGKEVYKACGCSKCNGGYAGRTIVPELLEVTESIQMAIHDRVSSKEIERLAIKQGMVKQTTYAYDLVKEGVTSIEEVFRIFGGVSSEEANS